MLSITITVLFGRVLLTFPIAVTCRKQLRKEGCVLTQGLRVQSISVGKA